MPTEQRPLDAEFLYLLMGTRDIKRLMANEMQSKSECLLAFARFPRRGKYVLGREGLAWHDEEHCQAAAYVAALDVGRVAFTREHADELRPSIRTTRGLPPVLKECSRPQEECQVLALDSVLSPIWVHSVCVLGEPHARVHTDMTDRTKVNAYRRGVCKSEDDPIEKDLSRPFYGVDAMHCRIRGLAQFAHGSLGCGLCGSYQNWSGCQTLFGPDSGKVFAQPTILMKGLSLSDKFQAFDTLARRLAQHDIQVDPQLMAAVRYKASLLGGRPGGVVLNELA